jgi:hypothetical protein
MSKKILSSAKVPDWLWGATCLLFGECQGSFLELKREGLKLTTHLHLLPRLRMSGAIPILLLYAFIITFY